jgi:hypothetical protein
VSTPVLLAVPRWYSTPVMRTSYLSSREAQDPSGILEVLEGACWWAGPGSAMSGCGAGTAVPGTAVPITPRTPHCRVRALGRATGPIHA